MTPFDTFLHAVLTQGGQVAHKAGSATLEAHHILLAIAAEQEATTREILASAGLDHQAIQDALDREYEHSLNAAGVSLASFNLPAPSRPGSGGSLPIGASAKLALERGVFSAARKKDLVPAHVLLGILQAEVGTVPRALDLAGVDRPALMARTLQAVTTEA